MGTVPANTLTNGRGDDVAGHNRRQLLDDPRSAAEEPMVCMTLRWSGMDSNDQFRARERLNKWAGTWMGHSHLLAGDGTGQFGRVGVVLRCLRGLSAGCGHITPGDSAANDGAP